MGAIMSHRQILAAMIGFTIVVVFARAHATSFIIELTNGREVTTSHVWEDGDDIKFDAPQGTAGFPKTLVKRITTVTPVNTNTSAPNAPALNLGDANASPPGEPLPTQTTRETERRPEVGPGQSSP